MREAMKEFPGDKLKIVQKFVKKRKNWENFQVVKAEVRGSRVGAELNVDNNREKEVQERVLKRNAKYIEWKKGL